VLVCFCTLISDEFKFGENKKTKHYVDIMNNDRYYYNDIELRREIICDCREMFTKKHIVLIYLIDSHRHGISFFFKYYLNFRCYLHNKFVLIHLYLLRLDFIYKKIYLMILIYDPTSGITFLAKMKTV